MANVKITDLTELAAVDLATNDVLPIVDINNDSTKKVTIATLTGLSDANDFVTYTQLNSNIDVVSGNVDAVEANVASIVDTGGHTVTFSGNVIPSADGVYDLGSASAKWKDLHLTGASIKLGGITISDLGNEGISITGASGEQANVVTPQLGGAANVSANIATLEANVASTDTRLGANITLLTDEDTALQSRLATNVTTFTNEDTALQARIAANTLVAASNDFITFTRLQANIDLVQDNVAAISVTLGVRGDGGTNDDVTVGTEELVFLGDTGITTTVSSNTVTIDLDDTAVSPGLYGGVSGGVTNVAAVTIDATGRITNASNVSVVTNLDTLQDNINVLDGNADAIAADVTALETRRAANVTLSDAEDTAIQSRLTTNVTLFLNEDTALQSRLATNVTTFTNEDTALQARIAANTLVAAANDFVTFTRLQANIDLVQDNVTTASGGSDGVEARRVANIAGAVSTITTDDLTASRAVVSDGSGKIAVSAVTATELGYLDGVSSAIQTQLDAKAALAGATFTGEVTMSDDLIVTGNLTVNGDTTTVSTTNLDVEDRMIMLADGVTGSPSADVGLLFNRGNQGNAAFFYDESAKTFKLSDTKDPKSNTSLSPVTASNLSVGIIDAATVKFDGTSVQDAISANVTTLTNEDTALQSRLTTNVTAFTNEDTALQARITANATITTAVEARRVANIAGAVSTITTGNLTASRALASDGSGKITVSAVTATELGYLDGVSSTIQTQIDSKQATITGAATTIDDTNLTASRAVVSDGSGKIAVSAVTATELGYLDGVSSAIQTQLDAKGTTTEDTAIEARRVANIAGAISTVLTSDLTADRVMITDGSGKISQSSGVTPTELGYLDGLTLGTVAASKAVTADANGDVTFIREVDIDGNVVIGTNASNTVTIVGVLDLGAFS
jgi:tellurite resistance protein